MDTIESLLAENASLAGGDEPKTAPTTELGALLAENAALPDRPMPQPVGEAPWHAQVGKGVGYGLSKWPGAVSGMAQAGLDFANPLRHTPALINTMADLGGFLGFDTTNFRGMGERVPDPTAPIDEYSQRGTAAMKTGFEGMVGLDPEPPLREQPPLQQLVNRITENVAYAPMGATRALSLGANLIRGGGEAIGAGIGAQLGSNMNSPAAEVVGDILGGGAGRLAAGKVGDISRTADGISGVRDPRTGRDFDPSVGKQAAVAVQNPINELVPEGGATRQQIGAEIGANTVDDIPGATVGMVSDSPVMKVIDTGVRTGDDTKAAAVLADQKLNKHAIDTVADLADDTVDSSLVARQADVDLNAERTASEANVNAAVDELDAAQKAVPEAPVMQETVPELPEARMNVADKIETSRNLQRTHRDMLYESVETNSPAGKPYVVPMRPKAGGIPKGTSPLARGSETDFPLQDSINKLKSESGVLGGNDETLLNQIGKITARLDDGTGWLRLEDLVGQRKKIGDLARDFPDKGDVTKSLKELRGAIDDEIFLLLQKTGPQSDFASGVTNARNYMIDTYGPNFGADEGAEVSKALDTSEKLGKAGMAQKFMKPTSKNAAGVKSSEQLAKILEDGTARGMDDAANKQVMREYVISDLQQMVADSGNKLTPATVRKLQKNYRDMLPAFPELKTEIDGLLTDAMNRVDNVTDKAELLKTSQREHTAFQHKLDSDPRNVLTGKDGPKNGERAVKAIYGAGNPTEKMSQLLTKLDEPSKASLKKAFAEDLIERATTMAGDKTSLEIVKMARKHSDVLSQVFSPEEMRNINKVANIAKMVSNRGMNTLSGSNTAANERTQRLISSGIGAALRLHFGMLKGGGIHKILKDWWGVVGGDKVDTSEKMVARFINRAALDPKLMKKLVEMDIPKDDARSWAPLATLIKETTSAED